MSNIFNLIRETSGQIFRYINFVSKNFKLFYVVLGLTLVVLFLEYLATSLMIPLAPSQNLNSSRVTKIWTLAAEILGLEPKGRTWLWLFFVLMTINLMLGFLLNVLAVWLGKRVHETLSGRVFRHILLNEPLGNVYTRSVGHYIHMAGDDTFKSGTIVSSLLQMLVGILSAMVGMLVLYQFSHEIFFLLLVFLFFSCIFISMVMAQVIETNNLAVDLSRKLGTTFIEALNSIRSIRSLHSENFIVKTYANQIHRYVRMLVKIDAIKSGIRIFPAILILLAASILLRPGFSLDMADEVLLAGAVILVRIFGSLGQMVAAGSHLFTDIRAIKDIALLVGLGNETAQKLYTLPNLQIKTLSLSNISFSYGDRKSLLRNINYFFEVGKCYAIVGPSGVGKSTLADIILGLSMPDSGELVVNEGSLSFYMARKKILLVEQQPKIFSASLRDNILLGIKVNDDVLLDALDVVSLMELVEDIDSGLDTELYYLGENFSGGQRQRIGIARALVNNPDVLILDEATSALDSLTRSKVVSKLRVKMRNGIIIFITHDLEIAELADEILELSIPEMG